MKYTRHEQKDRILKCRFEIGSLVGLRPDRNLYNTLLLEEPKGKDSKKIFTVTGDMIGMVINYIDDSLSAEVLMGGHVVLMSPSTMLSMNGEQNLAQIDNVTPSCNFQDRARKDLNDNN